MTCEQDNGGLRTAASYCFDRIPCGYRVWVDIVFARIHSFSLSVLRVDWNRNSGGLYSFNAPVSGSLEIYTSVVKT